MYFCIQWNYIYIQWKIFGIYENIFIFNKIYLYLIKNICIQWKMFDILEITFELGSKLMSKIELFITYSHYREVHPGLPQTSKMESFTKLINTSKILTIVTKGSIVGVVAVLDPPIGWKQLWLFTLLRRNNQLRDQFLLVQLEKNLMASIKCIATVQYKSIT